MAAVLVSQVFYLLLVWTNLKMHTLTWRLWWIAMIPAVALTHTMTLRLWAGQMSIVERVTRIRKAELPSERMITGGRNCLALRTGSCQKAPV